jgi:integrase
MPKLTAKTVAAAKLPAGKTDAIIFCSEMPGFGLRLRCSGDQVRRSWIIQYRRAGATRRFLLGSAEVLSAEQARAAAKKMLATVALGEDPQADKAERRAKDSHTLRALVAEYLAAKKGTVRPRTHGALAAYLTGSYFRPLHAMPVDTVTRKDVAARLVAITREHGSIVAARARGALSTFYVWAMGNGLAELNPVVGTLKPKDAEARERVLDDRDLAHIWRAAGDDAYGKVIKLLILTGARRAEVGGMRWSEIDRKRAVWLVPATRTKNGRPLMLPLPPLAMTIIESVPERVGRDHLFGTRSSVGLSHWHAKADLDQRLGNAVRPWRLHDLRRTCATRMCDLGVAPHVVEQILNHQSGHRSGVAGIYNRSSYEREVRVAMALWNDHVCGLVEGNERKIVPIQAAKAGKSKNF